MSQFTRLRGWAASVAAVALALPLIGLVAVPASADTRPTPPTPETVSARGLPTWQIDGVAWSQTMIGNTVFVTGDFTSARPPGVAVGGAGSIPARNFFAYDVTTGNPISKYSHALSGVGYSVVASPDRKRVYVGGDFTRVDGNARGHIAAIDVATGALVQGFEPDVDSKVQSIATSGDTVYVGGPFSTANGAARNTLAAFDTTGNLLPWAPTTTGGLVLSMVVTPDTSKVVLGGQFSSVNGTMVYGLGAVDATTGSSVPWKANETIRSYNKGGFTSLHTDGTYVYGTTFAFGTGGTYEGPFVLNQDGTIHWLADCHGDTYDATISGGVVYSVGHAHNCAAIGSFPDTNPRVRWQRGMAMSLEATRTNTGPDAYGWNFNGKPAPSVLTFWPDLGRGTFTGQGQAAWTASSNENYLALGGEFPTINGAAQQGLVRFAKASVDPTTRPPRLQTVPQRTILPTRAVVLPGGTIKVLQQSAWDEDNENLTYEVFRDQGKPNQKLVATVTRASSFYQLPELTVTDLNVPPGPHNYRVRISDQTGNTLWATRSSDVEVTGDTSAYQGLLLTQGANSLWRLNEASGTNVFDAAGSLDGIAGSGVSRGAAGALNNEGDKASTFNGTVNGFAGLGSAPAPAPSTYSMSAWFKTSSFNGGRIIGYSSNATGSSGTADRMLYVDSNKKLRFGAITGTNTNSSLASTANVNDGQWHHAAATFGPDGMALYLDGVVVARDQRMSGAYPYDGYWRIGGDSISTAWAARPSSGYLNGQIDEVAVFPLQLSGTEIAEQYRASGRQLSSTPSPTDSYGSAVAASAPSQYWRLNEQAGPLVRSTGSTENGLTSSSGVTYNVFGVTGADRAMRMDGRAGSIGAVGTHVLEDNYSGEIWFKTTNTRGGKLFGVGDSQSGLSAAVERTVSLTNDGKVRFSTGGSTETAVQSDNRYNNGAWHHVVATQSKTEMSLYVDGVLVGYQSVPQPVHPTYGYWRVGGDTVVSGSSSSYLAADLDEFATYSRVLPLSEVKAHYRAAGMQVANTPPTGTISSDPQGLRVGFAVSASDADGSVTSVTWNFGDGTTGSGTTSSHLYAAAGSYPVSATITDNDGASTTVRSNVTVANQAPTAVATATATEAKVVVEATGSFDPDGTITAYSWNFGDGSTGSGATAEHTYAQSGSYQVTLTVTDNNGATGTSSQTVTVDANRLPTAQFSTAVNRLHVDVDGSGSSDPDGALASYRWDFGDGSTATGAQAAHDYATGGTYQVTLTVTDADGATAEKTETVTVVGPFAVDAFDREVATGWGNATVGGDWASTAAANTGYSVTGGSASLRAGAGATAATRLNTAASDTDLRLQFTPTAPATGGSQYFTVYAKGNNTNGYGARLVTSTTQARTLSITRSVNNAETVLVSKNLTDKMVAGTSYELRVRTVTTGTATTSATTTVEVKLWQSGSAEPTNWELSSSDGTAALQSVGGIATRLYAGGAVTGGPVEYRIDNLLAQTP